MKYSGVEWIGEIPENWSTPKVKYHALFFNGDRGKNYPGDDDLQSEGIPFITSNNLHELVLNINPSISKYITNECYNRLGGAKIQLNDILFCLRGSVGICAINKELRDGTVASSLMDVRPVRIDADFLNYFFHSELANAQTIAYMNGSCAANLSAEAVSNYYLLLPNVTEQQQIVHFLDRKCTAIDTAIEKTKKSIEKLEEYKKAVITKAVTKGIDPNAKMKDSGVEWIGEIPENWKILRIKNVAWLKGRIGWDGLKANEFQEDGPFLITGTDFKNGYINWNTCVHITEERYTEDELLHIRENDLLITKDGTVGKLAIVQNCPDKVSLNSGVMIIRNIGKFKYQTRFMYYILMSNIFKNWFDAEQKPGSTIKHLYQHQFYEFKIPYLDGTEQTQIIHFLDRKCTAIDAAIEKKKKAIEKWEEYKKSLIYYAVTGKIDCRNEVI